MNYKNTTINMKIRLLLFQFLLLNSIVTSAQKKLWKPIDNNATKETRALFSNLHKLSSNHIMFGHQHATEYGHGWENVEDRSDVKSVTGSHPAVIGIDFSSLSGVPDDFIERQKIRLRRTIEDTYNRGGLTTIAWHFNNPVSKGGFYWVDTVSKPAVKYIIPGGEAHEKYKQILRTVADLVKSSKGKDGKTVPMIFRPYHEFDGDWFWWGRSHCTIDEFKTLWRFTVSYLRDSLQVHNLLYAFSPDNKFNSEEFFLERYPGNEWVDLVGMDDYGDFGRDGKYDLEAGYKKFQIMLRSRVNWLLLLKQVWNLFQIAIGGPVNYWQH